MGGACCGIGGGCISCGCKDGIGGGRGIGGACGCAKPPYGRAGEPPPKTAKGCWTAAGRTAGCGGRGGCSGGAAPSSVSMMASAPAGFPLCTSCTSWSSRPVAKARSSETEAEPMRVVLRTASGRQLRRKESKRWVGDGRCLCPLVEHFQAKVATRISRLYAETEVFVEEWLAPAVCCFVSEGKAKRKAEAEA